MRLEFFLLLAGVYICKADAIWDVDIASQLQHFTSQRFANEKYEAEHEEVRDYIKEFLTHNGMWVKTQEFNTSINTNIININPKDEMVTGVNIIGLSEAISDKPEAVIVVGADYDTNGIDDPVFNNGAGMAVLLETARLFQYNVKWSRKFVQNFTVLFVAFDLNTKEHQASGGRPGAWYFVREWLWSYLNKTDLNFGGAYIIDSVMNINQVDNSQIVNEDFRQMFPETYDRVVESGSKGNFLSMVTLDREKSLKLRDQFSANYNKDRMKIPYRLEDMTLPKSLPVNKLLAALTRQDTIHFWAFEYNNETKPLPALLLSDTETLRNIPLNVDCLKTCSMEDKLTPERDEFLVSTTHALTATLLSRQASPVISAGNLVITLPSLIISVVMMVMALKQ